MGRARIPPPDPDAALLPYQAAWIADPSRLKLCEKSRQIGLSFTAAYGAAERCARRGAKHDQWVSSRDEPLAVQFIEDAKFWAEVLGQAAEDMGEIVLDPEARIMARRLAFASGRSIYSMSSNPDAQAGRRGARLLDEFALHPDPRKLYTIAAPGLTWGGQMEVISTHRGSENYFNELIREIVEGGNPKNFSRHRVTLRDALDQGFLHKLQSKLPAGDERQDMDEDEYFEWVRRGCVDEETFLQEYMCQPADDAAAFLSHDLIVSAEYPAGADWRMSLETAERAAARAPRPRLYAGVDIGRTAHLTYLWVLERLGDVFYTRHHQGLRNMRKSEQEAILWPWFAVCDRVCIDRTGLGIGWCDDAQDEFGERRVEGVQFTGAAKEAMAYALRGRMEDRRLRIPRDRAIRASLRKTRKTTTAAGNIRFDAESDSAGHADEFWALALAIEAGGAETGPFEYAATRSVRPTADLDGGEGAARRWRGAGRAHGWQSQLGGFM
ncbi:MAG: terminase family protein [Gammaproteobacteria bacterium]|nr:terminase family protein [Gammaproteobacteria bacterium]